LKTIAAITDTGIQKILRNYLAYKGNNPEIAFTPEGLEEMNTNIKKYNDGNAHQPIRKVRVFELGSKFSLGETGNKKDKRNRIGNR
jgi:CRISPR-associated endonuclease Csn1